jgi:DNA-binding transcriptional MerR regulator
MTSGPFTLVQLADAAGMTVEEVRHYRDFPLLPPPRRRRGRQDDRGFNSEHVDRLRFIKRALAHGFTLDMIAHCVESTGLLTCGDVYRLSLTRLEQLRAEHGSADPIVVRLESLIAKCARRGGRADCQLLATLSAQPEPN